MRWPVAVAELAGRSTRGAPLDVGLPATCGAAPASWVAVKLVGASSESGADEALATGTALALALATGKDGREGSGPAAVAAVDENRVLPPIAPPAASASPSAATPTHATRGNGVDALVEAFEATAPRSGWAPGSASVTEPQVSA